jgi:hypothetical protein
MITDEELSQLLAQCTLAQRPQPDQLRSDQEQRHERRRRV